MSQHCGEASTMSTATTRSRRRTPPRTRFEGIVRPYAKADVERLRGSVHDRAHARDARRASGSGSCSTPSRYVPALGALTGNQAVQKVRAGLKAIYLSGWQVAADANIAGQMYPDQSLYPGEQRARASCAASTRRSQRADQIEHAEGKAERNWFAPIVADAEAGFGGPLNAFELMKAMIEAGAAGVHFEDQLASEKKCGHMGGKVLVPTSAVHPHARRGAPRGRRVRRADAPRRAHRRRQREAPHERRRRARPPVHHEPASARPRASSASRAASRRRSRAASPTRRTRT